MVDLNKEHVVTLREARSLPFLRRNGKQPHITTLLAWSRRGLRGQRLETVRIGRTLCTSPEALERFFRAVSIAFDEPANPEPACGVRD